MTILKPFRRYEGAPQDGAAGPRMPADELNANLSNLVISELLGRLERFTSGEEGAHMYPWAKGFAMGYPLPTWQRELVWTLEQKVRFIHSIWSGVDVGSYMVNDIYEFVGPAERQYYREFSEILLDGQQRLTALEEYVYDGFAVPDAAGTPRFWSELSRIERRRFGSFHFAKATIRSWDEALLRRAYDLRAFGGTPHTEAERASNNYHPGEVLDSPEHVAHMAQLAIDRLPSADTPAQE